MPTDPLAMVRCELSARGLISLAQRRNQGTRALDLGYTIHCWLREAWGETWPKPFAWNEEADTIEVLGYRRSDNAGTQVHDPDGLLVRPAESRAMPATWPDAHRLAFRLQTVASRRISKRGKSLPPPPGIEGATTAGPGDEVDAYQHHLARSPNTAPRPDLREQVYIDWLQERVNGDAGCTFTDVRIEGVKRQILQRKPQRDTPGAARPPPRQVELPAVTFTGALTVTDSDAFTAFLAKGVGRHKAFGFGMMLLRPAP
ncbi:MAG: type I-E CRISPR-associated protein Cas6/Cse3/CasE [Planctomycetota bacterium]